MRAITTIREYVYKVHPVLLLITTPTHHCPSPDQSMSNGVSVLLSITTTTHHCHVARSVRAQWCVNVTIDHHTDTPLPRRQISPCPMVCQCNNRSPHRHTIATSLFSNPRRFDSFHPTLTTVSFEWNVCCVPVHGHPSGFERNHGGIVCILHSTASPPLYV